MEKKESLRYVAIRIIRISIGCMMTIALSRLTSRFASEFPQLGEQIKAERVQVQDKFAYT